MIVDSQLNRYRRLAFLLSAILLPLFAVGMLPWLNVAHAGKQPAGASLAQSAVVTPTVQFSQANYAVNEGAGTAVITVTLSSIITSSVRVTYHTGAGTADPDTDYTPVSGTLTFAPETMLLTFTVPITDDQSLELPEIILLTLTDPISATLGVPATATLIILDDDDIDENHALYLPLIVTPPVWEQVADNFNLQTRSIAVCPGDDAIRYAGTTDGLYRWDSAGANWDRVTAVGGVNIPGEIRGIAFVNETTCADVYAISHRDGVWRGQQGNWQPVGHPAVNASLDYLRGVVVREGAQVFLAGSFGVFWADATAGTHEWQATTITGLATAVSTQQERVFATVWTIGAQYNDACDTTTCTWSVPTAPTGDKFVMDVLGRPSTSSEPWLLATTTALYRWQDESWQPPAAPPPATTVYALAAHGSRLFAGLDDGGVWFSGDDGRTWGQLGALPAAANTVRDLYVAGGYLYAATSSGIWRWPLP
ncbi:MAG: hypothetical protein IAE79_21785 [Anaerolinea sp.]|nr:hypothetical protein [Anaerolinea sp.]